MTLATEREDLVESSLIFIIGAVFGSFLNVVIFRLPLNQSLIPSSCCPRCKAKISWYTNIPIFSSIFLRFQCQHCKEKISYQYICVEIISAFVSLFLYLKHGISTELFYSCILFYILIVLAFIDLKYKAVPDYLLVLAFISVFFASKFTFFNALYYAILFAGGFALLEFLLTFYIQNIKYKFTKNEELKQMKSLGEGDIPIVAIIGALLGTYSGMFAVFLAAFFAIIPASYSYFKQKEPMIPFIPYLLLGLGVEYLFEISKVIR